MVSIAAKRCNPLTAARRGPLRPPAILFAFLIMIAFTASGPRGRAASAGKTATTPILLELFTSEGCSSCPPMDTFLEKLDASQPVPGAQLIVLSEHVDYWNHDGWKDPYSSSLLTDRQSGYVRALGLNTPYTPQIIIDGSTELRASGSEQVFQMLQKATATPKISVQIGSVTVDPNTPTVLRARIEVNGNSLRRNADIFMVIALDHAESQVLRGENGGRHLTHVAVVEELAKVGKLEKGKDFSQVVQVKVKPGTDLKNIRIVAFVQEPGPGKVLGTALEKPPS